MSELDPSEIAGPPAPPERKQTEELYCHMDLTRTCGPDCMAYLTHPPVDNDYKGQSWAKCRLLVDSYRVGKHVTLLVQAANAAVRPRTAPIPPPNPLGGK
jgi:hypothetical protein